MLVIAIYFLPVELAAPSGCGLFFDFVAVRDRAVDGDGCPSRIARVIGMTGSTGLTTINMVGNDRLSEGRSTAPLFIRPDVD
jgi:hypothetical protein